MRAGGHGQRAPTVLGPTCRTERPIPRPRTGLQGQAFDHNTAVLPSSLAGRNGLGNPGSTSVQYVSCYQSIETPLSEGR